MKQLHSGSSNTESIGQLSPPAPPLESYWPEALPAPQSADRHEPEFAPAYLRIVRRHWIAVLAGILLGAALGTLLQISQVRVYLARASVEVQPLNENFLNMRDVSPTAVGGAPFRPDYDIQTQVKILQSSALLERVVDKLGIRDRLGPDKGPTALSELSKRFGLKPDNLGSVPEDPASLAARRLKVRAQPNTRLIEVLYESTDPKAAANFANTLTAELIEYNLQTRWAAARHTGEWLARQMQDVRTNLERSERQLQAYAQANGLLLTSERTNLREQKLRQLQEELSRAEADRIARQSKHELSSQSAPESLPDALDDATTKEYQVKLTDLRRQYAELVAALTPLHPKAKKVDAQIREMELALDQARANIIRRIRNEFEAAQRREALLASGYANQSRLVSDEASKVAHYDLLKRQVDTMRQLYENMLQRVNEASVASALRASNIRVIDVAKPPRNAYKPKLSLNLTLGLFAGCLFGVCFAAWREHGDRSIHEPGDTPSFLRLSELAVVPSVTQSRRLGGAGLGRISGGSTLLKLSEAEVADGTRAAQKKILRPHTPEFAESIRYALTSLLLAGRDGNRPRVVVVSSPQSGEGKTTIASNLAVALAEIKERVLLIDGDLLRPRLHEIFGIENKDGLGDVLAGRLPFAAVPTVIPNLFLLTSGSGDDRNALYTFALAAFIRRIREEFSTILIDAPPVLQAPDARLLGRCADAMILVVRSGQTSRDALLQTCERLTEDSIPLLGTILNGWDSKRSTSYAYRRYYGTERPLR